MDQAINNKSKIKHIGRYQLEDKLGEGASGVVFRAYDPVMDRDVAIKSAKADILTEEQIKEVIEEFHYEAKIAGKYAHENIVTIYDVIRHDRLDHIVMEYVPGRSVQDYMKATGPLDVDEALSIVHKCCVGLAYIHYHGVIHRDIKPGNIMYHPAQGIAKLMDFSVAHNIEDPPGLYSVSASLGCNGDSKARKVFERTRARAVSGSAYETTAASKTSSSLCNIQVRKGGCVRAV